MTGGPHTLETPAGEVPLHEYRLTLAGRTWSILHTGAMLTPEDERLYLSEKEEKDRLPYGVVLWPAAIALAHEVGSRGDGLAGRSVLELGAGTGLPGIVAGSYGARVVQTDRNELALAVCRRNGERNGVRTLEHRIADWTSWTDDDRYDLIIGSDIIYATSVHDELMAIFVRNLAPGGSVILSDPFRMVSLPILDQLEATGWQASVSKWSVGEEGEPRSVGVYEFTRP